MPLCLGVTVGRTCFCMCSETVVRLNIHLPYRRGYSASVYLHERRFTGKEHFVPLWSWMVSRPRPCLMVHTEYFWSVEFKLVSLHFGKLVSLSYQPMVDSSWLSGGQQDSLKPFLATRHSILQINLSLSQLFTEKEYFVSLWSWMVSKPRHGSWFTRGWWRLALLSPDGVAPSRMFGVSASVNLPLHHEVQKFSFGIISPGLSRKKRAVRWLWCPWIVAVIRRHPVWPYLLPCSRKSPTVCV